MDVHMVRRPQVADVIAAVAEYSGLSLQEISERTHKHRIAHIRQIAMYLAYEVTGCSYPMIGRRMGGFDHTSILFGARRVRRLMQESPTFTATVQAIRNAIRLDHAGQFAASCAFAAAEVQAEHRRQTEAIARRAAIEVPRRARAWALREAGFLPEFA